MKAPSKRPGREPTIALINVVFLMLIFFMVAGTLAPDPGRDVALIDTETLEGREPAGALVLHADGRLSAQGRAMDTVDPYVAALPEDRIARLLADRAADARTVLRVADALRQAGAASVLLIARRHER